MSVKAMAWVWEQSLPRDEKFVLLAYADHADHDGGNIYPGVELIARKTGYSVRSVQRITRSLEKRGYLIPVTGQQGGRGVSAHWRLPLEENHFKDIITADKKGDKMSPFNEKKGDTAMSPFNEEKGDKMSPFNKKGDTAMSPFNEEKGDTAMSPFSKKGDIAMSPEPLINNNIKNIGGAINASPPPLKDELFSSVSSLEFMKDKQSKSSRSRDERLNHPALKLYRGIMHLHVPVPFRETVIQTIGESPSALEAWRRLLMDWLGHGWNKANIAGILDAYKSGGIQKKTSDRNRNRIYPENEDEEFARLNPHLTPHLTRRQK